MLIPQLAFRNIIGAGLRTWLNVFVLSISFIVIIGMQGIYEGMNQQVSQAQIEVEYGGGQFWQENYDPYDPFSFEDSHALLPAEIIALIAGGKATPILLVPGTIYSGGQMRSAQLKGISPTQDIMNLPVQFLAHDEHGIPAIIGQRMAKALGVVENDYVTIRYRDAQGAFDARDVHIRHIFNSMVQTVDLGQIWLPLIELQRLTNMPNEATLVVVKSGLQPPTVNDIPAGWNFRDLDFLLKDLHEIIKSKRIGGSIFYAVLMILAMLAIFDTQVFSIFRRRKEMGTMMALGMMRRQLIGLFTLEGAMHGVLAMLLAMLFGAPLLIAFSRSGMALPDTYDSYGIALGDTLYPVYTVGLVIGTILLVLLTTTIVSYLPTRKIAKLKPNEALRGNLT